MDINNLLLNIFTGLPGLLLAVVFHEYAHAFMANKFGDPTAKHAGRLTFNPQAHFDMLGTVIFPLIGAMIGGVMFGWAKPVPIDTRYFKDYRKGVFWVSAAGPIANLILVVTFTIVLAVLNTYVNPTFSYYDTFAQMLTQAIQINIVIAAFNLIPWPPLDGSKMVSTFMEHDTARKYEELSRYWFIMLLVIWTTPLLDIFIQPFFYLTNVLYGMFLMVL